MIFLVIILLLSTLVPIIGIATSAGMMFISKRYYIVYCLLFSALIAAPALFFYPDNTMDAYRYFSAMNFFKNYQSFSELWRSLGDLNGLGQYKNYPLTVLIMQGIARTRHYTLISFVTVFLGYTCVFLPIISLYHNFLQKQSEKVFAIFVFLALLFTNHYLFYMSVFRYYLAGSIFIFILVYARRNKLLNYFYLIPLAIHPGTIFFVVARLAGVFIKKITGFRIILVEICIAVFFVVLNMAKSMNLAYLTYFFEKFNTYTSDHPLLEVTTKSMMMEFIYLVSILIFIFIYLRLSIILTSQEKRMDIISVTTLILAIAVINLVPFNDMFLRYAGIIIVLTLFFYVKNFESLNTLERSIIIITIIVLILSGIWMNQDLRKVIFIPTPKYIYFTPVINWFKDIPTW